MRVVDVHNASATAGSAKLRTKQLLRSERYGLGDMMLSSSTASRCLSHDDGMIART